MKKVRNFETHPLPAYQTDAQRKAAFYARLDREERRKADAAVICDCGTINAEHAPNCWAKPMRRFPFERSGFKTTKPLPWKVTAVPATRWFTRTVDAHVLPMSNPLFKGAWKE